MAGALDDIERIIAVEQLPAPVREALMSFGKKSKILQVEENIDGGVATYEIDLLLADTYHEVEFDAEGNMIGTEIEAWIVSLASVPELARRAFEDEASGAAIVEVRMEMEEDLGEYVYEADIRNMKRTYALRIDGNGTLIERDITLDMLPPGAYWALARAAQGGWIVELDEELHDGKLSYEANIVVGRVEFELSVDADGNVVELNYP
ncbi:PepSY-like domain-containing protein [Sorangium sp. So ce1335]|uniref:PepSY-like domain-containing protein n=1 Tax=Sorangium sp. So ce1335 TaxID=3133335 RepID=UPI003F61F868